MGNCHHCNIDFKFISILNLNKSGQVMTQQIVLRTPPKTENICTTCKHFIDFEEIFFCGFFDAFLSAETLCILCDFQEKIESSVLSYWKSGVFTGNIPIILVNKRLLSIKLLCSIARMCICVLHKYIFGYNIHNLIDVSLNYLFQWNPRRI